MSRYHKISLLVVVALGFALRLNYLEDASIWWDEGLAVWAARQSPLEIVRWTSADVHPPLYFWLLHFWRMVAGDSEFAVRFPSVLFGTLTLVALWKLGRSLAPAGRWVPLAATLLLATSRFAIWWSQEARMYMLGALLATLSLLFTVRLRRAVTPFNVAGYLASTIACLWTLYLLAFLLVIEGLYWLWSLHALPAWRQRGRSLLLWAALQVATLAAFLPWLAYALPRMRSWSVRVDFDPLLYLELYATLLSTGISTDVEQYRGVALFVVGVLLLGWGSLALGRREGGVGRPGGFLLLVLALVVPPGVVWLVTTLPRSFGYLPKPEARYLLPFAPAFYLLLAWSIAAIAARLGRARQAGAAALLLLLLLVAGWSTRDYYQARYLEDDYKSIALTLRAHRQPGDLVLLHTDDPWPLFAYHWPAPFKGTPHLQDASVENADYFLQPLWEQSEAIWLVVNEDALRMDPQRLYEGWLSERARSQEEWRFGSKRLLLFSRTAARAATGLALAPGFVPPRPPALEGAGPQLVGWEQPLRRLRAGESAYVALYLRAQEAPQQVTVRLGKPAIASASGRVAAGEGIVRLLLSLRVPPDASGGRATWWLTTSQEETALSAVELLAGDSRPVARDVEPRYPLRVSLGEPASIRLLGYDIEVGQAGSGTVALTLYWESLAPLNHSYKVFTHLVNEEGRVVAQRDDFPVEGERPTNGWLPGEIIVDRYEIPVEPERVGAYRLVVGLYDPLTGERLGPVLDGSGREQPDRQLSLGTVTIESESASFSAAR